MELSIQAQERKPGGNREARRLRQVQRVPAVLYGGDKAPQHLSIEHKQLMKASENENFYSQVINIHINGKAEKVVLKELQRHPFKPLFMHADFLRIRADVKITMRIPIHYTNTETCKGVKQQGGVLSYDLAELDITCLPQNLPAFIEVDVQKMELNDILHLSDIKLPSGVEAVSLLQDKEGEHDHDLPVVRIVQPRIAAEEEEEEERLAAEAEAAEETEETAEEED